MGIVRKKNDSARSVRLLYHCIKTWFLWTFGVTVQPAELLRHPAIENRFVMGRMPYLFGRRNRYLKTAEHLTGRLCWERRMKEKFLAALHKRKREQIVVWLLLAALVIVIFWPVGSKEEKTDTSLEDGTQTETGAEVSGQETAMEQALADTLAQVEGVGAVRVALTLESTNRKIVEKDIPDSQSSETRRSGDESSESSSLSREESTVYERDGSGSEIPYVVSEEYPAVRGVLIVAEGGDNPVVVQEIQEAVMALFHVDAHKIKVMKMKERSSR